MRLDGDEMTADADDGDPGHYSGTYMAAEALADPGMRTGRLSCAGA
jgi:hypothetical protein